METMEMEMMAMTEKVAMATAEMAIVGMTETAVAATVIMVAADNRDSGSRNDRDSMSEGTLAHK
jgi:hypothetical protein